MKKLLIFLFGAGLAIAAQNDLKILQEGAGGVNAQRLVPSSGVINSTATFRSQLGIAPLASPTFTGTVTIPTPFVLGAVSVVPTGTELNFVDGVTSPIQTQLDAKATTTGLIVKIATFSVDGGGAAIATGTISGTTRIPFACTLTGCSITATAATGTNTVEVWLKATATTIPTVANIITTAVSLTTGTAVEAGTSDFTDTTYAAGDMARCAITAVDGTATDLTVTLYGTRL